VQTRRGESLSTLILSISSGILEIIHVYKRVFIDGIASLVSRRRYFVPFCYHEKQHTGICCAVLVTAFTGLCDGLHIAQAKAEVRDYIHYLETVCLAVCLLFNP